MINTNLSFSLPPPWENQSFKIDQVGPINFLVGPNGSGKSQFARVLSKQLQRLAGNSHLVRLLGTDRLEGMEQAATLERFGSRKFSDGFSKRQFGDLKQAGAAGSGIDTFVLLEERMDLRIQIQATLSHLFDREISLEWNAGFLIPTASRSGNGASYRLDREECHGIKELLILLTHLYDDRHQYLIIDEPELNLHPQYQAFVMQEVRKLAGDPLADSKKKVIFLITHSPFILDLRSSEDLNSIMSFNLEYSEPTQIAELNLNISSSNPFLRRLNAHHKQLFFSDNPVFVEGIHDAWLIEAMMEALGVSVASAGSCIIDAGGVEQVNQYLKLCQGLGKTAHFLYDLDSLFSGNLGTCVGDDESIKHFLASAGLGNDFIQYRGQLAQNLTCLIDRLLNKSLPPSLRQLERFLKDLGERSSWKQEQWAKARTAVMTAISLHRKDIVSAASQQLVVDIEGRRDQILNALNKKNVHVLPGGTIERYLPHYRGGEYELSADTKRNAINAEIEEMTSLAKEQLSERYGDLYSTVIKLPSKKEVDVEAVLRNYLSEYIHRLQRTVVNNPEFEIHQIQQQLSKLEPSSNNVLSIQDFNRRDDGFSATIGIVKMLGQRERVVRVDERTNAGMDDFQIEFTEIVNEDKP